jgi:hypothetical protein
MTSYKAFAIVGLLLVTITIVIQSAPIKKTKKIIHSSSINNKQAANQHLFKSDDSKSTSPSTTTSSTPTGSQSSLSTTEIKQEKKKRYINDDQLNQFLDYINDEANIDLSPDVKSNNNNDKTDHILHAKIQETSEPVDTDDSKVFSDIKMTPNELTNIVRRRRNIKLNDETNRRRKRALSPYDFYDTDSFYDPYADLIERHQYVRPTRSFAPIYWYPSVYERNIRSALEPSFYEPSEWPILYSNTLDEDDDDEIPVSLSDDENDYESNRYPILLQSPPNPFDSLQQYNTDDLPIDEDFEENFGNDDDDEQYPLFYEKQRPYYTRSGPVEIDF